MTDTLKDQKNEGAGERPRQKRKINSFKKYPVGYTLSAIVLLLALALVLVGWDNSRNQVAQARQQTAVANKTIQVLETAYGNLRLQIVKSNLVPDEPPLVTLIGSAQIVGSPATDPPILTFNLSIQNQNVTLVCVDPTNTGSYNCQSSPESVP